MRVCVTGGTGFTGAALVLRLLNDGHSVRVLDNKPGSIAAELTARGAELTYGSVTDRAVVAGAVAGCDVVMHLAAAFREVEASDSLVSRGEPRRLADRWRGKLEGQRPKVRVLQHARHPRPHRKPAGR